jgi:hypothetical protein
MSGGVDFAGTRVYKIRYVFRFDLKGFENGIQKGDFIFS